MRKINVVLAGLGFGGAFAPVYSRHPDVLNFGVFDPGLDLAKAVSDRLGNVKVYASFEDVLDLFNNPVGCRRLKSVGL